MVKGPWNAAQTDILHQAVSALDLKEGDILSTDIKKIQSTYLPQRTFNSICDKLHGTNFWKELKAGTSRGVGGMLITTYVAVVTNFFSPRELH